VGSGRRAAAAEYDGHIFVAPDNGIIPFVIKDENPCSVVFLENEDFFLKPLSDTFHGRDVFAPAGAHLVSGTPLKEAGRHVRLDALKRLLFPGPYVSENVLTGRIISTDRFGNIVTNIDSEAIEKFLIKNSGKKPLFSLGDQHIEDLSKYYGTADENAPVALIGSRGFLEIAVNRGSAKERFTAKKGDAVRVAAV